MSLAKNLQALTRVRPKPVVTWDKCERITRNQEVWADPKSIVHRLPQHYVKRYWNNILSDATPVHYEPPEHAVMWDPKRLVEVRTEEYPIRPENVPEMDKGLWGGEGIVKGYRESRPYTKKKVLPRHWVPHWWFPNVYEYPFYSEVLDKYLRISVTPRAISLIDAAYGLDLYLLTTPEIDVNSKLGMRLKREILIKLANGDYYHDDEEKRAYIKQKYADYTIPLEEAEWVGLDLNEAAQKQQLIEDYTTPEPLKYKYERELLEKLGSGEDLKTQEADFVPRKSKSVFAEKYLGRFMKPIEEKVRR